MMTPLRVHDFEAAREPPALRAAPTERVGRGDLRAAFQAALPALAPFALALVQRLERELTQLALHEPATLAGHHADTATGAHLSFEPHGDLNTRVSLLPAICDEATENLMTRLRRHVVF